MKRGAARADVFSPWMRRLVLGILFVSCCGVVFGLFWGARFAIPQAGETDSLGGGPIGHRAFAETLERAGMHVLQMRSDRYETASSPMLFIEPRPEARVEGRLHQLRDVLIDRDRAGVRSMVVLPKWSFQVGLVMDGAVNPVTPERLGRVVEAIDYVGDASAARVTLQEGESRDVLEGILGSFAVDVPQLQTFATPPALSTVLLESARGAVVVELANGIVVVSDPDLIHSYNFHRADHAALAFSLVQRLGGDTVIIDETFHGHGAVLSLKEALGQFPAVLVLIHVLAVFMLVLMLGSKRFGPPEVDAGYGAGPEEAIAVAASVLADGQAIGRLAYNYVVEVLGDLHRQLGLPDGASIDARAQRIDTAAEQRRVPPVATKLLQEARAQADGKQAAEAWKIARAAHGFRSRMLGTKVGKGASG